MDRVLNPRDEKQTIYEIYRACRLCGAGAGYKMPIIQNVVDLDGDGVELRQKIKECVQIEVNHTDRMPPLICELCVDKVNDFYEFLDMCKQNNKRTRLRLGLPLQTRTRDSIDSENCILGVTEPMFMDSDGETLNRNKNKNSRIKKEPIEAKIKTDKGTTIKEPVLFSSEDTKPLAQRKNKKIRILREFEVKSKTENRPSPKPEQKPRRDSRESSEEPRWAVMSRGKKRAQSPPKRTTRQTAEAPTITNQLTETPKTTKLLLKKTDDLLIERKLKRPREKDIKIDTPPPPPKKIKMAPEPVKVSKPGPKSSKIIQEPLKITPKSAKPASKKDLKPSPPSKTTSKPLPSKALPSKALPSKALPSKALPSKALPSKALPSKALPSKATLLPKASKPFYCKICNVQTKTSQGFAQHNTKHVPNFTSPKQACNACELWFSTVEETSLHHRYHRSQNVPYKCTRCYGYFKLQQAYEDHFGEQLCLSVYEVPDVKCWECWKTFPTNKLMEEHKCPGEDGRPGGKCRKCRRFYSLLKNLVKHESTCTHKKKGEVKIDPKIQARLLPMQVRIARCDPLIKDGKRVDSAKVSQRYGLDRKCEYPYLSVQIKPEPKPFNPMVSIDESVKEEFCDSYIHWDSDSNDSETGSVDTDSSQKQVDSLSAISLKTIFSKKCIGKVPKRKRNVKSEAFDSFNVDLDLVKKIDNIIDNLDDEDAQTTCSNDSDSILDEGAANSTVNQTKNDSSIVSLMKDDSKTGSIDSDSILDTIESEETAKVEDSRISDDTVGKYDVTSNKQNETSEINEETSEKQNNASVKVDEITEKTDVTSDKQNDSHTFEKVDDTSKKPDDTSDKLDDTFEKQDDASERCVDTPDEIQTRNVPVDSEKETINTANEDQESVKERDDPKSVETDINDDVKQNENHVNSKSDDKITNHDKTDDRISSETNLINEINLKNGKVDSNNQLESLKYENKDGNITESNIENNDSDKMYVDQNVTQNTVKNSVNHDDNDTVSHDSGEIEKPSENYENFSKINEITNEILKNQTSHELTKQDNDHHKSDPNSDSVCLKSVRSENGVENQDRFNVNDLSEDDRMLMAELDAQIGENDQKFTENDHKSTENDQKTKVRETKHHLIDDLLKKQDSDLRSLDLDSISDDEFNFDV